MVAFLSARRMIAERNDPLHVAKHSRYSLRGCRYTEHGEYREDAQAKLIGMHTLIPEWPRNPAAGLIALHHFVLAQTGGLHGVA